MFRFLGKIRDFSFLQNFQTSGGTYPIRFPLGSGSDSSFPDVKQQRCEAIHSPTSSAESKNKWNTVMRRITTFRSTTDRIYDGGPIIYRLINP